MTESYASVVLGGEDRNAEFLGILVTWLVSNGLIAGALERRAAKAVSRLKLQDLTGAGFLTTVLDGELRPEHLSDAGQQFVETYFVSGQYQTDFDNTPFDDATEDEWRHYDAVAPKITAAWRAHQKPAKQSVLAKVLKFPSRR